jgi:predicted KAP-like P-loop ATPase
MKFGNVRIPQLSTSELLEVNAIFFVIGRTLGNLIPKVMKVYSWGIPQTVVFTRFSIKEQRL